MLLILLNREKRNLVWVFVVESYVDLDSLSKPAAHHSSLSLNTLRIVIESYQYLMEYEIVHTLTSSSQGIRMSNANTSMENMATSGNAVMKYEDSVHLLMRIIGHRFFKNLLLLIFLTKSKETEIQTYQ